MTESRFIRRLLAALFWVYATGLVGSIVVFAGPSRALPVAGLIGGYVGTRTAFRWLCDRLSWLQWWRVNAMGPGVLGCALLLAFIAAVQISQPNVVMVGP